jgi:hypothetical protein
LRRLAPLLALFALLAGCDDAELPAELPRQIQPTPEWRGGNRGQLYIAGIAVADRCSCAWEIAPGSVRGGSSGRAGP